MKLSQCLNETVSYPSPLECERITIFVDKDANESVFNDVQRISSALFENSSRHIKLNVIRDGDSFTITCSFPLILSEQLITAALNNIDVLKENKVKRLTIGYCTVYEVNDTSTPSKCGLMKQLMLSLSVQLINSTEEVTTLNEENIAVKTEAESCKELLDTKIKMLKASLSENEKLKIKATETNQLLQEKVSHLTEHEEENEKLKEIKELLEEQLVLFQSQEEEFIQEGSLLETIEIQKHDEEIQQLKIQLASYQKQKESEEKSFAEIMKLQSATDKDESK
ncbi:PREDICTED: protein NETWORKED 1D-like [Amphimedon queenslandica]|uniref:Spindle assembly abnormal protein 6 N-terminal domain-containing protein n=1 Tax=Amphimedon queenslandica TaxID=400682 RepID=A0A1X7SM78_AMPQE|nr:PREDICTED: protein NETWORKED 1D-like [Amphimedon queenslandica]|eukprot:XP_019863404.1 PREDICTED: protein NETWORKED 1D-like [Amphimedon queenslandica]